MESQRTTESKMVRTVEPEVVSLNDAARFLTVSRGTIYNMMYRGELPTVKVGRRRLVRLQDLRDLINGSTK